MGKIELTEQDWTWLQGAKNDLAELVAERNKYKNLYESQKRLLIDLEARLISTLMEMCRELERKVPGLDLEHVIETMKNG
jgi:hypothetical protein